MTLQDQEVVRSAGKAAEQRAYPRQPVRLPAVFTLTRGGVERQCEIRDFCPGGMLLIYGPMDDPGHLPVVGDVIDLRASLRAGTVADTVTFTARVVRSDGHSAGVALLSPSAAALQSMAALARHQLASDTSDQPYAADVKPIGSNSAQGIIEAYRRVYVDELAPIMQAFISAANERLFELAKTPPACRPKTATSPRSG